MPKSRLRKSRFKEKFQIQLSAEDKAKKQARYKLKFDEAMKMDKDTIKKLFNETKMSRTDRLAMFDALKQILYNEEMLKLESKKDGDTITPLLEIDATPED